MKYRFMIVAGSIAMLAGQAFSGPLDVLMVNRDWKWIGSISAGPVWEDAGQTQTFNLTPSIEKTYAAEHSTDTLADGEVFVGIQKDLPRAFQGQLGLAVVATSNANLAGNIWDDADSAFNNYTYSYQIQHTHLALKGKLLKDFGYRMIPWVSASVGVGFNQAHNFQNSPLIPEAVAIPNFTSNTQTSFTYTLGVGIQLPVNQFWQAGVGYEFSDWGQSQLGSASGQTVNSGLSLNHLYTNGFLLNLTYIA